ncbi:unnamed protein product [Calypogeia fissa]
MIEQVEKLKPNKATILPESFKLASSKHPSTKLNLREDIVLKAYMCLKGARLTSASHRYKTVRHWSTSCFLSHIFYSVTGPPRAKLAVLCSVFDLCHSPSRRA